MNTDLTYTNKAGISLQNVLDVLIGKEATAKKDILTELNTDKSIDVLLKKLEEASLIEKQKAGNKLLYTISTINSIVEEEKPIKKSTTKKKATTKKSTTKKKATTKKSTKKKSVDKKTVDKKDESVSAPKRNITKAKPSNIRTPAEVKDINEKTSNVTKDHQITALVEIDDDIPVKSTTPSSSEVNEGDLEILKKEMEGRLGKEVTAVLHKRNDRAIKDRKKTAREIYESQQKQISSDSEEYESDNPYRFVLNFFTSTLNGEKATPYFRRRDEYVVKSIYNKFKALCAPVEDYAVTPQNLPFYRVITINEKDMSVKIYHIDMNRIVRGVHTVFKLNQFDNMFLKFKDQ